MGENENEGRDFPFGKGSGTAVVTSGIGLTTCKTENGHSYETGKRE